MKLNGNSVVLFRLDELSRRVEERDYLLREVLVQLESLRPQIESVKTEIGIDYEAFVETIAYLNRNLTRIAQSRSEI